MFILALQTLCVRVCMRTCARACVCLSTVKSVPLYCLVGPALVHDKHSLHHAVRFMHVLLHVIYPFVMINAIFAGLFTHGNDRVSLYCLTCQHKYIGNAQKSCRYMGRPNMNGQFTNENRHQCMAARGCSVFPATIIYL